MDVHEKKKWHNDQHFSFAMGKSVQRTKKKQRNGKILRQLIRMMICYVEKPMLIESFFFPINIESTTQFVCNTKSTPKIMTSNIANDSWTISMRDLFIFSSSNRPGLYFNDFIYSIDRERELKQSGINWKSKQKRATTTKTSDSWCSTIPKIDRHTLEDQIVWTERLRHTTNATELDFL